jgi:hypothetical protein
LIFRGKSLDAAIIKRSLLFDFQMKFEKQGFLNLLMPEKSEKIIAPNKV